MHNVATLLELAELEVSRRLKNLPIRPRQLEVLTALAEGKNVFAGLPTGYGKSLCYWAPAAAWGWKVWVVSPLVSLIQDQALACAELGISVAAWHSGLPPASRQSLAEKMECGDASITFLSPERLAQWWEQGFVKSLERNGQGPDLLVMDEMHCFEDWRSFRPGFHAAYAPIRRMVSKGVLFLGLSASLSKVETTAWMNEFCSEFVYVGSTLGRDNLCLKVLPLESEEERWLNLVASLKNLAQDRAILIYCATRTETDEVANWLNSAGYQASSYHAGLPSQVRSARSKAFRAGYLRIVCATSAFGMGIDFPRVARVIHFSLPYSLESYWQEAGRAGRDGNAADAIVFWRRSEITRARRMNLLEKEKYFALWNAWSSGRCRKRVVAEQLGLSEGDCGQCDRCERKIQGEKEPWWVSQAAHLPEWAAEKIFAESKKS